MEKQKTKHALIMPNGKVYKKEGGNHALRAQAEPQGGKAIIPRVPKNFLTR